MPFPPSLQGELDELEREEFFRLKKVQGNKKKHAEAAAAKEAEDEVGGNVLLCGCVRTCVCGALVGIMAASAAHCNRAPAALVHPSRRRRLRGAAARQPTAPAHQQPRRSSSSSSSSKATCWACRMQRLFSEALRCLVFLSPAFPLLLRFPPVLSRLCCHEC